jgi:hypothetical protein
MTVHQDTRPKENRSQLANMGNAWSGPTATDVLLLEEKEVEMPDVSAARTPHSSCIHARAGCSCH